MSVRAGVAMQARSGLLRLHPPIAAAWILRVDSGRFDRSGAQTV